MSRVVDLGGGATVEIFPDGTRVQRTADGTTLKMCVDGTKIQTKAGVSLVVRPDGSRLQTQPTGVTLETFNDGRTIQVNLDSTRIELFPDRRRVQSNPDGTVISVSPDGEQVQVFTNGQKLHVTRNGKVTVVTDDSSLPAWFRANPRVPESTKTSTATPEAPPTAPPMPPAKSSSKSKSGSRRPSMSSHTSKSKSGLDKSSKDDKDKRHRKDSKKPHREHREHREHRSENRHRDRSKDSAASSNRRADERKALKGRVEELESALLENEAGNSRELSNVQDDLLAATKRADEGEDKIKQVGVENEKKMIQAKEDLRMQSESLNQRIKALESSNESASSKAKKGGQDLQSKLMEVQASLAKAEQAHRSDQQRVLVLEKELSNEKTKAIALQEEQHDVMGTQVPQLVDEIATLRVENESLEAQVDGLIFKGGTVAEHVMELKTERDELDAKSRLAFEEVSELREELTSHLSQLASSEEQLADALREVARMAERAAKSEALESQIDLIIEEKVRMKERIVDLQKRSEVNGGSGEKALNRTVNDLQRKLEVAVKDSKRLAQSVASFKVQEKDNNTQLSILEEKLRLSEQMPVMGTAAHNGSVSPKGKGGGKKGSKLETKNLKSTESTKSIAELMKLKAEQRTNRANQIESIIKKGRGGFS